MSWVQNATRFLGDSLFIVQISASVAIFCELFLPVANQGRMG